MTVDKYPEFILEREFIGYGYSQPNPQWPGGAKICVNFLINHNVGAESSIVNGDKGGMCI
ncbi:hypothetical protein EHS25_004054 [Saitozyma podzolica]|uniref:Uncharacterized protein n=1 Tax=Saitozyma podzolica TaxID=1890683 RepID=A0A427YTB5_9TREE|nr:hypothetical protein EHS25_004054 [Saitozyma podzolica]